LIQLNSAMPPSTARVVPVGVTPMDSVELLVVTECFEFEHDGVVVKPDFPCPEGNWEARVLDVEIVRPNGSRRQTSARIAVWHFEFSDPTISSDRRWRLMVSFPGMMKSDLPIGTRVIVPRALKAAMALRL
jgi:hypothetical protein